MKNQELLKLFHKDQKDFDLQTLNINNVKGVATLNILKELNVVEDNSKLILPIALYFK